MADEALEERSGTDLTIEDFETPPTDTKEEVVEEKVEDAAETVDDAPDELKVTDGLAPELEKHRKGMHRAYTKAREKLAQREADIDEFEERSAKVDKFYNDKAYGAQLVQQWAKANGVTLTRTGLPVAAETPTAPALPPGYVETVKAQLPVELQAMAPAIAQASAVLNQQQQAQQQTATDAENVTKRNEVVATLMEELNADVPGWQEHEEEMLELLDFLESNELTHKVYGSKGKLLHRIVTGNASAVNEAAKNMRTAARHKGVKPQGSKGPTGLAERIRSAKTEDEAWALANEDALGNYSGSLLE